MSSLNKVMLIGNVGRDPETRRMNNGDAVVTFSLATTESWRDKGSGERRDKTTWHNVVIWNEALGKIAEQYVSKGSKIYIEGAIEHREYTDKEGNKRQATEIVLQKFRGGLTLLSGRQEGGGRDRDRDRDDDYRSSSSSKSSGGGGSGRAPIDDDIPF